MGKLLFLDLDGTLLNDQKEITPGNLAALQGAMARGHRVVITTGRPLKSAIIQAKRLGLAGEGCYVISFNGAIVYDLHREAQIYHQGMDKASVRRVFDEADRRGLHVQAYDDVDVIVEPRCDNASVRRYCGAIHMDFRVVDSVDVLPDPIKVLIIDYQHRQPMEEMAQWLRREMAGQVDCYFSSRYLLEVASVGMNKGAALRAMCARLGAPVADTIAVGDEANDIYMLQAAGVGVAMANATPETQAAADYVTRRDNNHDGIAEVVERFLTP